MTYRHIKYSGSLNCVVFGEAPRDERHPRPSRRGDIPKGSPKTHRAIFYTECDKELELLARSYGADMVQVAHYKGINDEAVEIVKRAVKSANLGEVVSFHKLLYRGGESRGPEESGSSVLA